MDSQNELMIFREITCIVQSSALIVTNYSAKFNDIFIKSFARFFVIKANVNLDHFLFGELTET